MVRWPSRMFQTVVRPLALKRGKPWSFVDAACGFHPFDVGEVVKSLPAIGRSSSAACRLAPKGTGRHRAIGESQCSGSFEPQHGVGRDVVGDVALRLDGCEEVRSLGLHLPPGSGGDGKITNL